MFVEFRSGIGRQSLADSPSQALPGNEDNLEEGLKSERSNLSEGLKSSLLTDLVYPRAIAPSDTEIN